MYGKRGRNRGGRGRRWVGKGTLPSSMMGYSCIGRSKEEGAGHIHVDICEVHNGMWEEGYSCPVQVQSISYDLVPLVNSKGRDGDEPPALFPTVAVEWMSNTVSPWQDLLSLPHTNKKQRIEILYRTVGTLWYELSFHSPVLSSSLSSLHNLTTLFIFESEFSPISLWNL